MLVGDIFRLINNTPEYYSEESLDFQLLCRLYDVVNNGYIFNAQTIPNILNTSVCNSNMLQLLQTKLGFFTQSHLNDSNLYGALQVFMYLVHNKGSKQAIQSAVNLFSKLNNIQKQISVVYNIYETQYEAITIPARAIIIGVEDKITDLTLLHELFRYILPAGIPYYIYFYQNVKEFTTVLLQNKAELLFVTDSINAQIRQIVFGYYDDSTNKFYYDNTLTTEITPINYNLYMDKSDNQTYVYISGTGYVTEADMPNRLITGVDTTLLTSPASSDTTESTIEQSFYVYQLDYDAGEGKRRVNQYVNDTLQSSYYVNVGDEVTLPTMSATGYTYTAWTSTDVTISNNKFTMIDSDVNVYCTFTINTHTLTYYLNSSQYGNVETYSYGEAIVQIADPTQTGYNFSGWSPTVPATMPDNDISTYGTLSANTYYVVFNANAPSGTTVSGTMSNESFTYNVPKQLTQNSYSIDGYEFIGWNTKADGTGTSYEDEQFVSNLTVNNSVAVNLYAQWQSLTDYLSNTRWVFNNAINLLNQPSTLNLTFTNSATPNQSFDGIKIESPNMMYYSQNNVYPETANYDSWRRIYSTGTVDNSEDLTGTTWQFYLHPQIDGYFPNHSPQGSNYGTYNINFTSNSTEFQSIKGYYMDWVVLTQYINYDQTQVYYGAGSTPNWNDTSYRTITITGGADVKNIKLIHWLKDNATLLSGTLKAIDLDVNKKYNLIGSGNVYFNNKYFTVTSDIANAKKIEIVFKRKYPEYVTISYGESDSSLNRTDIYFQTGTPDETITVNVISDTRWLSASDKTITITGGSDVRNESVYNWLTNNATQQLYNP